MNRVPARFHNFQTGMAIAPWMREDDGIVVVPHGRLEKVEVDLDEVKDNVKQIVEGHDALLITIRKGNDELLEKIGRRLDPLEKAVRQHFRT